MRLARALLALLIVVATASAPVLASAAERADHAGPSSAAVLGDHHSPLDKDAAPECCQVDNTRLASCNFDLTAVESAGPLGMTAARQDVSAFPERRLTGIDPTAAPEPPRTV